MRVGPRDLAFWVLVTVLVLGSGVTGGWVVRLLDRPDAASQAVLAEAQALAERRTRDLAAAEAENRELVEAAEAAEGRSADLEQQARTQRVAMRTMRKEARARDAADQEREAKAKAIRVARRKAVAAERTLTGELVVPAVDGALVTQVGGSPGQPLDTLTKGQAKRLDRLREDLQGGRTFPCAAGAGGDFADVVAGTPVTAADEEGTMLVEGVLTGGVLTAEGCTFGFELRVPAAEDYRIRVAERDGTSYSRDDLEAGGWQVSQRL